MTPQGCIAIPRGSLSSPSACRRTWWNWIFPRLGSGPRGEEHDDHMPLTSHAELPDPEVARQEIRDAFSELGPVLAKQARAHAEAVRRFLERGEPRGTDGREEALRLLTDIADQTTGSRSWQLRVSLSLKGSFDTGTTP